MSTLHTHPHPHLYLYHELADPNFPPPPPASGSRTSTATRTRRTWATTTSWPTSPSRRTTPSAASATSSSRYVPSACVRSVEPGSVVGLADPGFPYVYDMNRKCSSRAGRRRGTRTRRRETIRGGGWCHVCVQLSERTTPSSKEIQASGSTFGLLRLVRFFRFGFGGGRAPFFVCSPSRPFLCKSSLSTL